SESKVPPSSPTPNSTSRGEFDRQASGLSKIPSSQNFTNDLSLAPDVIQQKAIVHQKEPLPRHFRSSPGYR
ncbi:MAG: hypothetical protein AAFY56_24160, partial [Pseudomonadota bacterium]